MLFSIVASQGFCELRIWRIPGILSGTIIPRSKESGFTNIRMAEALNFSLFFRVIRISSICGFDIRMPLVVQNIA